MRLAIWVSSASSRRVQLDQLGREPLDEPQVELRAVAADEVHLARQARQRRQVAQRATRNDRDRRLRQRCQSPDGGDRLGERLRLRRVVDERRERAVVVAADEELGHPWRCGRARRATRHRASTSMPGSCAPTPLNRTASGALRSVRNERAQRSTSCARRYRCMICIRRRPSAGSTWIARISASLTSSGSCGLHRNACRSSFAAPANSLSTSAPPWSIRAATYSFATRFIPSRRGRHHHHVGGAVQRRELGAAVRLVQVVHGRQADAAEVAVDPPDLALDPDPQQLVVLDPLPARCRDLDHGRLGARERPVLEQLAERLEPKLDPLRVVEPVDTEDQRLRVAQLGADLAGPRLHGLGGRDLLHLLRVDRDRERTGRDVTSVDVERRAPVSQPEQVSGEPDEVLRREPLLESDEVGAEQPAEDLRPQRHLHEELDRRERECGGRSRSAGPVGGRAASPARAAAGSRAPRRWRLWPRRSAAASANRSFTVRYASRHARL